VKRTARYRLTVCAAVIAASPVAWASTASPKVHVVGSGQHLQSIAKLYRVSAEQLCKTNELRTDAMLKIGQRLKIPRAERGTDEVGRPSAGGAEEKSQSSSVKPKVTPIPSAVAPIRHEVTAGETLGEIAQRAGTTVEVLSALNALEKGRPLRVGQLLALPGVATSPRKAWQVYARRPKQRGFLDVSTHTSRFSGEVLGSDGRLRSQAVRALNNLLGASGTHPTLPERLVRLLIEVSDTFGGRPIRLVSGYRTSSYFEDSRHKSSSAIDFSVVGVPNAVVVEYLREIEDVGVGYYPNSSFVHMDVRGHSAYWVDYAGPGEPPRSTPNAPPRRPSSRPMRPADRRLVAELDRVLEETKRILEETGAAVPGHTAALTKPARERPAGSIPHARPASSAPSSAVDEPAVKVAQQEAGSEEPSDL
jgi:LysM repeat protein